MGRPRRSARRDHVGSARIAADAVGLSCGRGCGRHCARICAWAAHAQGAGMMRLVEMWRRIPRPALFVSVALVQAALIAAIVFDRASILRNGSEVMLSTRP